MGRHFILQWRENIERKYHVPSWGKQAARHLVDKLMGTGAKPEDQEFDEV
ncbi:hypothetical protein [Butyrivibrio sp. FCS014]|nr:hypothetical protein [Butyrivibrio sp. FCS014]